MGLKLKITLALLLGILVLAAIPAVSLRVAYAEQGNSDHGSHGDTGDHDHQHGHHGDDRNGCGSSGSGSSGSSGSGSTANSGATGDSHSGLTSRSAAATSSAAAPTSGPYTSRLRLPAYSGYYPPALLVVMVNVVNSTSVSGTPLFAIGMPLIIEFRVTDSFGRPVTLSPLTGSFMFTNSSGASYLLAGVTVSPVPNQPGNYTYVLTISADFPEGVVTTSVVAGSLQDAEGDIGPLETIASHNSQPPVDQTPSSFDNSIFTIVPPPFAYIPPATFPSLILALILLTLILQVRIQRGKRRAKSD